MMYCWGSTVHGELGLGGIEEEQIFTPVPAKWSQSCRVTYAACGESHTLLLTADGKIYSCGNNDFGQLGHEQPTKRPQLVTALDAYRMVSVSCGVQHSLAVNEWGQAFGWGSDERGQLGLGAGAPVRAPRILRALATQHVVQLACGGHHSLALMSNGDIYSWGANTYGQLGLGKFSPVEEKPQLISSLGGVPFSFIAAGGYHTFAISKSGAVFGWGKNTSGQVGLNDLENHCYPSHLKSLRTIKVCHVSCGEDFTVFLTLDGGVFTCGSGTYGQLGHGSTRDEVLPRKVSELMGTSVVQTVCGRRHLLVLTEPGRLQSCGVAGAGQLGLGPMVPGAPCVTQPRTIKPAWQSVLQSDVPEDAVSLYRVFAGGDRCFVTLQASRGPVYDSRSHLPDTQILSIDQDKLEPCLALAEDEQVDQETLCYLETTFRSLACVNGSFLLPHQQHYGCNSRTSGIDFTQAARVFDLIKRIKNISILEVILQSLTSALEGLNSNPPDCEALRCFLTLPLYHECLNPRRWRALQGPLAAVLGSLRPSPQAYLTAWCHSLPARPFFPLIVGCFKEVVHHYFKVRGDKRIDYDWRIIHVLNALESLNKINMSNSSKLRSPPDIFYIPALDTLVDVRQDYLNWLTDSQMNNFYLCNYPFLFDVTCKSSLLELDQAIQMHAAMNQAATRALLEVLEHGRPLVQQFIVLNVSRDNIVTDTIRELAQYGTSELKKPLKIKFCGEEAEDAGGVRKEFFLLLLREILDPKYGMFKHYPDTNLVWFAEDAYEDESMYLLIGVICGLAIYNFTIINVPFPLALYKKLLRAPVSLDDLAQLSPVTANSLRSLLQHPDNDVEEVFSLTFEISSEVYGQVRSQPLKEGGANIAVSKDNREEFVDLYVDFIFNKSIESKFVAFHNGFYKVCGGRVLKLFEPHELMAVVSGNEDYDWQALQDTAEYRGGYSPTDPNILAFWEVLHEMSDQDKRNFLLFLTGSDRIPIQGMKAIVITIQPTTDDKFLPVAHTCFNLLDLPRYSTKEKLKYKLLQSIQHTEGFSLV